MKPDSGMADTNVAQPANFAIQIALAAQSRQFGIKPDAVIGHSAGEVAAHYLAGALTFEQTIQVIYHRSRLQQRTSGTGRMLAVGLGARRSYRRSTQDAGRNRTAGIDRRNQQPVSHDRPGDSNVLDDIAVSSTSARSSTGISPEKRPITPITSNCVKADLGALSDTVVRRGDDPLYSTVAGERLNG